MAAIYSNGGNRWNILGFNFTKRDALSSVYKISMFLSCRKPRGSEGASPEYFLIISSSKTPLFASALIMDFRLANFQVK